MPDRVTNAIEMLVGLGCLVVAYGTRHERWLMVIFTVAGLAAVVHAAIALVSG